MNAYPYEGPHRAVFDLMVDIVDRIIGEKGYHGIDPHFQEQFHELNNRWKQLPPKLRARLAEHFKEVRAAFDQLPMKNETSRADLNAAGEELAMAAAAIVSLKDAAAQLNQDRAHFQEEQAKRGPTDVDEEFRRIRKKKSI